MLGGCPLTYASRLQSEIALGTTEAENIALSTAIRNLLPSYKSSSERNLTETVVVFCTEVYDSKSSLGR